MQRAARVPRDWAATYVKSVREGWCLPGKYLVREKGLERAENAQDEHEVAFALKVAEKAATGQRRASAELEESRLDVLWSELGAEEQENFDKTARERLGVLARTGRARAALVAMRRNLLREKEQAEKTSSMQNKTDAEGGSCSS